MAAWPKVFLLSVALCLQTAAAQPAAATQPIPPGAKIFLAPVEGGFENYVAAGIQKKKVPVVIVNSRDKAKYENLKRCGERKGELVPDARSRI